MNTQERIDKITEELRDIYQNTNEGPRLIAEMFEREFPSSLGLAMQPEIERLDAELEEAGGEIEKLEAKLEKRDATIDALETKIEELGE